MDNSDVSESETTSTPNGSGSASKGKAKGKNSRGTAGKKSPAPKARARTPAKPAVERPKRRSLSKAKGPPTKKASAQGVGEAVLTKSPEAQSSEGSGQGVGEAVLTKGSEAKASEGSGQGVGEAVMTKDSEGQTGPTGGQVAMSGESAGTKATDGRKEGPAAKDEAPTEAAPANPATGGEEAKLAATQQTGVAAAETTTATTDAAPTYTTIKGISPYKRTLAVKVRVPVEEPVQLREFSAKAPGQQAKKLLSLEVADPTARLQIKAWDGEAQHFAQVFESGKSYSIVAEGAELSKATYATVEMCALTVRQRTTQVTELKGETIAYVQPATTLMSIADARKLEANTQVLPDVLAVIGAGEEIVPGANGVSDRRRILLVQPDGACINLTLWSAEAVRGDLVVGTAVLVRKAKFRPFNGSPGLSTAAMTRISVSATAEADALKEWWIKDGHDANFCPF